MFRQINRPNRGLNAKNSGGKGTKEDGQEVLPEILNIISGNLLQVLPSCGDIRPCEILPSFDRTQLLAALEVRPRETHPFESPPDGVLFSLIGYDEEKTA